MGFPGFLIIPPELGEIEREKFSNLMEVDISLSRRPPENPVSIRKVEKKPTKNSKIENLIKTNIKCYLNIICTKYEVISDDTHRENLSFRKFYVLGRLKQLFYTFL